MKAPYILDALHYCETCKRVYVVYCAYAGYGRMYNVDYYEDWPTYGQPRKTCPKCGGWKELDGIIERQEDRIKRIKERRYGHLKTIQEDVQEGQDTQRNNRSSP